MMGLLFVLLGCGGSSTASPAPAPEDKATTPEAAVRNFMQAVADSNITRMSRFWGTSRGPASETGQPADYEDRLVVTQAYLRHSPFRLVRTDALPNQADRRAVQVEFERADADGKQCTRAVPFTVINTNDDGWIVVALDLNLIGTPGRSCVTPKTTP
jgi:hypothetical protein